MDIRAQQAREHHSRSVEKENEAAREREQRDRLVRALRADDPKRWSYGALSKAIGCSPELIAYIVKHPANGAPGSARPAETPAIREIRPAPAEECPHPPRRILKGLCGACGTYVGK